MTLWTLLLLVGAAFAVWQTVAYFSGNPKFWRLVHRNPDLALTLFQIEGGCVVDKPKPADGKYYYGPFRLRSTNGIHKIYIQESQLEVIQSRIAKVLYGAEGKAPHLGLH